MSSAVPTDEIYDRYLQKAISEINELGDEIGRAGDETHVPVLGSGHPLADVFLLKYAPQPSEVHEGVAFYGRAGQALLKSLQRLRVDPMAVYGTNCLKFGGEDPEEAKPWLVRELHIVQPKLLVLMGEQTVEFVNSLAFPLADPIDPAGEGLQRFTGTVEALVVPDIDAALDEAPAKTAFWNAFKAVGAWYAELPPVLSRSRWAALAGADGGARGSTRPASDRLWDAGLWPDVLFLSLVLIPATFLDPGWCCRWRSTAAGSSSPGSGSRCWRCCSGSPSSTCSSTSPSSSR